MPCHTSDSSLDWLTPDKTSLLPGNGPEEAAEEEHRTKGFLEKSWRLGMPGNRYLGFITSIYSSRLCICWNPGSGQSLVSFKSFKLCFILGLLSCVTLIVLASLLARFREVS